MRSMITITMRERMSKEINDKMNSYKEIYFRGNVSKETGKVFFFLFFLILFYYLFEVN